MSSRTLICSKETGFLRWGCIAWARVDESSDNNSLLNPAKRFTYQAPQNVNDTYVVFIIGKTTRWDHIGIFGYERNTTPKLAQEKNLAAFRSLFL
ncbi:sulfatase-like hydrolase/transferase [Escherichia coli]